MRDDGCNKSHKRKLLSNSNYATETTQQIDDTSNYEEVVEALNDSAVRGSTRDVSRTLTREEHVVPAIGINGGLLILSSRTPRERRQRQQPRVTKSGT